MTDGHTVRAVTGESSLDAAAELEQQTQDAAATLRSENYYVSVDLFTDSRGAAALSHIAEKTVRNRRT